MVVEGRGALWPSEDRAYHKLRVVIVHLVLKKRRRTFITAYSPSAGNVGVLKEGNIAIFGINRLIEITQRYKLLFVEYFVSIKKFRQNTS